MNIVTIEWYKFLKIIKIIAFHPPSPPPPPPPVVNIFVTFFSLIILYFFVIIRAYLIFTMIITCTGAHTQTTRDDNILYLISICFSYFLSHDTVSYNVYKLSFYNLQKKKKTTIFISLFLVFTLLNNYVFNCCVT